MPGTISRRENACKIRALGEFGYFGRYFRKSSIGASHPPQMLAGGTPDPPIPRRCPAGHPTRAGVRGPRSPLVDHAEAHVIDQENIVALTSNSTLSKTMLPGRIRAVQKPVLKTGPKAGFQ